MYGDVEMPETLPPDFLDDIDAMLREDAPTPVRGIKKGKGRGRGRPAKPKMEEKPKAPKKATFKKQPKSIRKRPAAATKQDAPEATVVESSAAGAEEGEEEELMDEDEGEDLDTLDGDHENVENGGAEDTVIMADVADVPLQHFHICSSFCSRCVDSDENHFVTDCVPMRHITYISSTFMGMSQMRSKLHCAYVGWKLANVA